MLLVDLENVSDLGIGITDSLGTTTECSVFGSVAKPERNTNGASHTPPCKYTAPLNLPWTHLHTPLENGGAADAKFAEPNAGVCVCVCEREREREREAYACCLGGDGGTRRLGQFDLTCLSPFHQMVGQNTGFPALSGPNLFVKQTKRFEHEAMRAFCFSASQQVFV